MSATPPPATAELIRSAYAAFNRRDIDGALAAMVPDVDWANGWEGGRVHGHDGVRAYWTRQWAELDSLAAPGAMSLAADGRIIVSVEQQIRQPDGEIVPAGDVQHIYTMRDGLVAHVEIVEP